MLLTVESSRVVAALGAAPQAIGVIFNEVEPPFPPLVPANAVLGSFVTRMPPRAWHPCWANALAGVVASWHHKLRCSLGRVEWRRFKRSRSSSSAISSAMTPAADARVNLEMLQSRDQRNTGEYRWPCCRICAKPRRFHRMHISTRRSSRTTSGSTIAQRASPLSSARHRRSRSSAPAPRACVPPTS
jgi:hypothetical protein